MIAARTLIDELEDAVAHREIEHRAKVLRRITDLFVTNSGQLSNEQIAVFDDVMARLLKEVDSAARRSLGHRLVEIETGPPGVIAELVMDDSIDIAGPVLTGCDRISDDLLVESALTKSQNHLLAISKRRELAVSVTDVLVERGNQQVAVSTTENPGAKFSEFGYATLVERAEDDRDLAACIWRRPEIPRRHLLTLFTTASKAVQRELQSINPHKADEIKNLVGRAKDELEGRSREASIAYVEARASVEALHKARKLTETDVRAFANAGKFDETSVALALMADVPVTLAERALIHEQYDRLLVLAKSIGLSFATVRVILSMPAFAADGARHDLEKADESFAKLSLDTARKTLQYYRLRMRAVAD
jgi:uncharacterized protein (DUF2336 family)